VENDGWHWQQTLRNGTTKGRSGKLVASCSRLWNSSAHSCEFCEQQQRRASTDQRVRWNCCPSQADAAAASTPAIPSVTSGRPVSPPLRATRVARICRPTNRPAENGQMDSSVRPSVRPSGCHQLFQPPKKKHMRCRVAVDILPSPLTPTDGRINKRKGGRTEGERTAHTRNWQQVHTRLNHSARKYFTQDVFTSASFNT